MKIGSLFAGIGGFDLAARWMGWKTAWYSEIDPYACRVMQQNFPGVPNLGDVTQLNGQVAPPVDLLCGGFPCQDLSIAGKGAGLDGARSGLWFHFARLVDEIRPRWVVAENVSALRSRGLDRVLGSLAALGYDAEWHCIPASAVGAPHRRDRIWIVAYPNGIASQPDGTIGTVGRASTSDEGARAEQQRVRNAADGCRASVANTNRQLGDEGREGDAAKGPRRWGANDVAWFGLSESPRSHEWWRTEPDVGRVAPWVPARVDRLRCLGNAIVPQVAYHIFRCIAATA